MRVCIIGAKERDTTADSEYVVNLMRAIKAATPNVIFITTLTHMGIGKFVRAACAVKDPVTNKHEFNLIDANVHIFVPSSALSKSDLAQIFMARNATPFELSDMLYYLATDARRGPMEDLLQRFIDHKRPYKILYPDDPIEVI
jgi:hypothetical protein